jgi:hypothetical protein
VNVVAAYEMVQYEEIHLQYNQLHMEGCDHDVHGKIPFQKMVDVKVWAKGEVTWKKKEDGMVLG